MQAISSTRALRGGLATRVQRHSRQVAIVKAVAAPVKEVLEEGSKGFAGDVPAGLNKYSGHITQPKSQGASQAMLYATGLNENDMNKPQVGNRRSEWVGVGEAVSRMPKTCDRPICWPGSTFPLP